MERIAADNPVIRFGTSNLEIFTVYFQIISFYPKFGLKEK